MKRIFFSTMLTVIIAATLVLGGCSSKSTDKAATTDNNAVTKAASEPTAAATATPAPVATSAPEATGWNVVTDCQVTHPTNIAGFFNDKLGITVGYSGEIHYTEDGGKTWPRATNQSYCRFSLDIQDKNLMWSGGNGNNVRVSKDGGKTWTAVSDVDLGGKHSNIDFIDDTTGWISTNARLAATKDGGKTWTPLELPAEAKGIGALCLRTAKDGYLLSNNGLFFSTNDGGATWAKHEFGFENLGICNISGKPQLVTSNWDMADISFTDENNGIMVMTGTKPREGSKTWILTTADGGNTWSAALLKTPDNYVPTRVFLTGDGKYLTLGTSDTHLLVYKHE